MSRRKAPQSEADLLALTRRQGGYLSFEDCFKGPWSGPDGAIHRAVFGDTVEDFNKKSKRPSKKRSGR